jgi:DGQHR domain-containing protein
VKKNIAVDRFVPAIRVRQWLPEWNSIQFDKSSQQAKPNPYFFLCSIKARDLKALTGVYRRSTKGKLARAKDPNVQRGHEEARSQIIREFVKYGFPWCEMTEARRSSPNASNLQKPGWLPTAILVNILPTDASRNGQRIAEKDVVRVIEEGSIAQINFPKTFKDSSWTPDSIFPLEVIDGQHRLWAFDGFDPGDDFELPVVAFVDLDRSWQAYLFWSVNITPKRINKSLAFDLYPLLRREDWLDQFSGHSIYRETRCQELVEALWSSEASPWYQRINMLGEKMAERERSVPMVTQAAWIRSLMSTFVKQWGGEGSKIGGVFGASKNQNDLLLPWNRPMQAAILLYAGKSLQQTIKASKDAWAEDLRSKEVPDLYERDDPAMFGSNSLLATDQGIRGFLSVVNDLLCISAEELDLRSWTWESIYEDSKAKALAATEEDAQNLAIKSLRKTEISKYIDQISAGLSEYDWRTSSTPGLPEKERLMKLAFRGSSGYRELRKQLLVHLAKKSGEVGASAKRVLVCLGY